MSKVIEANTKAELDAALASAPGTVAVDFVQDGCGACEEAKPHIEKLAETCPTLTVVRVDVEKLGFDAFKDTAYFDAVDGTPTTLVAKSGKAFTEGRVTEVDPSDERLARKLKCALPTKSTP